VATAVYFGLTGGLGMAGLPRANLGFTLGLGAGGTGVFAWIGARGLV